MTRSRILDDQKVAPRPALQVVRDEPLDLPRRDVPLWRVALGVGIGLGLLVLAIGASIVLGVAIAPIVGAAP